VVDVRVVEVDKARGRIGLRILGTEDDAPAPNGDGEDGERPRRRRRRLSAAE
jgi:transcriptional accessory protein Tex/SPT6